jgi:hypothetical protein
MCVSKKVIYEVQDLKRDKMAKLYTELNQGIGPTVGFWGKMRQARFWNVGWRKCLEKGLSFCADEVPQVTDAVWATCHIPNFFFL